MELIQLSKSNPQTVNGMAMREVEGTGGGKRERSPKSWDEYLREAKEKQQSNLKHHNEGITW